MAEIRRKTRRGGQDGSTCYYGSQSSSPEIASQIAAAGFDGQEAWGKVVALQSPRCGICRHIFIQASYLITMSRAIIPHDRESLAGDLVLSASQTSSTSDVRQIDQKLNVTNATLVKVPFDLERWQQVAAEEYPNGLPEPHSDDPTQWLFKGHPKGSTDPLQVAVARLLGYRWPDQEPDDTRRPGRPRRHRPHPRRARRAARRRAIAGGLAGRLRAGMVRIAGERAADRGRRQPGTTLDDWLRNSFFEQHCKRFHNRPFIWHIWDGRKDGFSCLVNYHKLDHKALENLTYSYLRTGSPPRPPPRRPARPGPTFGSPPPRSCRRSSSSSWPASPPTTSSSAGSRSPSSRSAGTPTSTTASG